MADILPSPIPSILPSLSGPALSFSSVRKVTDAAANLVTDLQGKIRKSVQEGLAAAGREGIRLETKVTNDLRKQLTPPELLVDHITSLVQNSIAGNMAQAVATFEDLTHTQGATSERQSNISGVMQQSESFLYQPALPKSSPALAATQRAVRLPGGGVSQLVRTDQGLVRVVGGEPVILPQDQVAACPIPSAAEQKRLQGIGQAVADATPPTEQDRITGVVGNWWSLTDDCCILGPDRNPGALTLQTPKPHWQVGIDGGPDQAVAGFKALQQAWNPKGIVCGTLPVDCKVHPDDPSCPCPDGSPPPCKPPTDGKPPPVCCPEIKIPPCPTPPPLPDCIHIDLCDWDKLCDVLKKCLKQATSEDCALDNETAYVFKDCDATYGEAQDGFLGELSGELAKADSLDAMYADSQQQVSILTDDDFPAGSPF